MLFLFILTCCISVYVPMQCNIQNCNINTNHVYIVHYRKHECRMKVVQVKINSEVLKQMYFKERMS
jgi:hypothetical protein